MAEEAKLPEIMPALVTIPLDPEVLNRALQAMKLGNTSFPTTRFVWVCPAGVTTIYTISLPEGLVCTRRTGILSSDFYDPNILVYQYVDGQLATPYPIPLTGETEIDSGEYYVKHRDLRFIVINGTAFNATLSWLKVSSLMEKSFYDSFYVPIIEYMFRTLEGVATYGKSVEM